MGARRGGETDQQSVIMRKTYLSSTLQTKLWKKMDG